MQPCVWNAASVLIEASGTVSVLRYEASRPKKDSKIEICDITLVLGWSTKHQLYQYVLSKKHSKKGETFVPYECESLDGVRVLVRSSRNRIQRTDMTPHTTYLTEYEVVFVRSSKPVSLIIVSNQVQVQALVRSSEPPVSQIVSVELDFHGVFQRGAIRVGNKNHFGLYFLSKWNFSGLFWKEI